MKDLSKIMSYLTKKEKFDEQDNIEDILPIIYLDAIEMQEAIGWDRTSQIMSLSEEIIRKYKNEFNWERLVEIQIDIPAELIEEFADVVDWYAVSQFQYISTEFIIKYSDKIDWYRLSMNQRITEETIDYFRDKMDWRQISQKREHLSPEFIIEHWNFLSPYGIPKCVDFSVNLYNESEELKLLIELNL